MQTRVAHTACSRKPDLPTEPNGTTRLSTQHAALGSCWIAGACAPRLHPTRRSDPGTVHASTAPVRQSPSHGRAPTAGHRRLHSLLLSGPRQVHIVSRPQGTTARTAHAGRVSTPLQHACGLHGLQAHVSGRCRGPPVTAPGYSRRLQPPVTAAGYSRRLQPPVTAGQVRLSAGWRS